MKRKPIGKRLRFEIFARDRFSCRYCGKTSEDVELVIDHLHPVAKGGTNDPENLVTSCHDCNAGKSDKTIDQAAVSESHKLALAQEMQEQRRALAAAEAAAKARAEIRQRILDYYCESRGVDSILKTCLSHYVSMVEKHGAEAVFSWIDIASRKVSSSKNDTNFLRYVYGIRRRVLEIQPQEDPNA